MNILLLDEDLETINFLNIIQSLRGYQVFFNDFSLDTFQNNDIDIVIVDIAIPKNNDTLNEILKLDPKQKVIIFSQTLDCKNESSCEHCLEFYNKKRLLKPLRLPSFLSLIDSFDAESCKYSKLNCFENILPILEKVMDRFPYYHYNKEEKLIYTKQKDTPFLVQQFLEVIRLLDEHNIIYEIQEERALKILTIES